MTHEPPAFLICLVVAIAAGATFLYKQAKYRRWIRVSGIVVEIVRCEIWTGEKQYVVLRPRISFRTASGEAIDFLSSVSSPQSIGDSIAVLYDPTEPHEATTNEFMARHLAEIVIFAVSMTGVLICAYEQFTA
ncbi:MAG: hypothetical protein JWP08_87 [Bryobacterales bacterium]|nr:hypothetical protein [Bryobacterales bacterium]